MELTIHNQVLISVFITAFVLGAVVNKTNFCTMGAVSDWVNFGDMDRMRSWLLAMAVAIAGVVLLEAGNIVSLPADTFPPYRTANFAWVRYVLGGFAFGVGMTLASGCGNKTLVRIGGGNIKSVVVLIFASLAAYAMLWTNFFNDYFMVWIRPTIIDLGNFNIQSQELASVVGGIAGVENTAQLHIGLGLAAAALLLFYVFRSSGFRDNKNTIVAGIVVGLAVVIGWYVTGGNYESWKEFADFSDEPPSRVAVQSYTFMSPMGDLVRYLKEPGNLSLINFGVIALFGVIAGSFVYAVVSKSFRLEWLAGTKDGISHAIGGVLMGTGGVLAMGCTIGQAIAGVSTLALGSLVTFFAIVFGAALTMKIQFHMIDGKTFTRAAYHSLAELRLFPAGKMGA